MNNYSILLIFFLIFSAGPIMRSFHRKDTISSYIRLKNRKITRTQEKSFIYNPFSVEIYAYLRIFANRQDVNTMLKEERQQYILNRINESYRIYITSLSSELGVSDDTLRRDLKELDERGLLTKVHGGAIARSGIPTEFTERLNRRVATRQQMAAKVIPLLQPGNVVWIDGGTYNLEVARQLPTDLELTVYTNSFPVVHALIHHPRLELIFLGGKVFPSSQVTVGVPVFQALQQVRPDWLILGISNVHPQKGLTVPDREEAMIKRCMTERAQKCIILADSQKLNTAEIYQVASLGDVDYLVTEDDKVEYIRENWPKYKYILL